MMVWKLASRLRVKPKLLERKTVRLHSLTLKAADTAPCSTSSLSGAFPASSQPLLMRSCRRCCKFLRRRLIIIWWYVEITNTTNLCTKTCFFSLLRASKRAHLHSPSFFRPLEVRAGSGSPELATTTNQTNYYILTIII